MDVFYTYFLSQLILFPVIAGFFRYRLVQRECSPFFWLLVLGLLCEEASFIFIENSHIKTNALPTNIYILCEWILLAIQFHQWGFLKKKRKWFIALVIATVMVWVTENLILHQINFFRPYFPFLYSFLVVILSVREINFMITHENRMLFRNPKFLICIGLIIYFIYKIIFEWAYQMSLLNASEFTQTIIFLFAYINAGTNIIFGIALLCIPGRKKFSLD